jgi:hypothetical protein
VCHFQTVTHNSGSVLFSALRDIVGPAPITRAYGALDIKLALERIGHFLTTQLTIRIVLEECL